MAGPEDVLTESDGRAVQDSDIEWIAEGVLEIDFHSELEIQRVPYPVAGQEADIDVGKGGLIDERPEDVGGDDGLVGPSEPRPDVGHQGVPAGFR